jgi:sugar lactone lactonase YvrE
MRSEPFGDPVMDHGEGAVWSDSWGGLRCVDMFRGDVLTYAGDGSIRRDHLGTMATVVRPVEGGGSLVARQRDVVLWRTTGEVTPLTGDLVQGEERLNEGGCTPNGGFLIGSLAPTEAGGTLFLLDGNGGTRVALARVTVSNGIGFSPDGHRAYYVDSATRRVDVFTVAEDGALVDRRPLVKFEPPEAPDGLWVDVEGAVWVAIYGGSRVERILPDGRRDDRVPIGARQVTSCTFGGSSGTTLFVTTSRERLAPGEDPLAGAMFAAETGVRGLPVLPFRPAAAGVASLGLV